jgi:ribosomal protein L11 methyltransferase
LAQPRCKPLLPDTQLTIYCLNGRVEANSISHAGFLGTWEDDGYSFLFFDQPADQVIEGLLDDHAGVDLEDRLTMSYRDWQGEAAGPLKIGTFLLSPPWLKRAAEDGEIGIIFDPGLVFGNGTHPTTLTCLKAIEIVCTGATVERMLDLGTGSGLLGLAAARLGCSRVIAVDKTMLAAATAAKNIAYNNLQHQILAVNGSAEDFAGLPSDLLVANIGFSVLTKILANTDLGSHRWLVLSGLLDDEAEQIRRRLEKLDVVIVKQWKSDAVWNTFLAITRCGR